HGPELGEAHRKIAIAVRLTREDLDVVRAVHRLEEVAVNIALAQTAGELGATAPLIRERIERLAFDHRRVLAVGVVGEVAAGAVKIELADVRGVDLEVPLLAEFLADERREFLAENPAAGSPEDQSLAHLLID